MSKVWEAPQVIRTGYVDQYNGMFEIVPVADNVTFSYWMELLVISIAEPAEGGDTGVVRLKFGDGTDWFEFNAHAVGVHKFDFGSDGYEICAKGSQGFQMTCDGAMTKQAKAWALFRGHKRLQ